MSMAASAPDSNNLGLPVQSRATRPAKSTKEYPMIELRPFNELGSADPGWLKARHHFSFGSHYDPSKLAHGSLRPWTDDELPPNTGFPSHPHPNSETSTYFPEGPTTLQFIHA